MVAFCRVLQSYEAPGNRTNCARKADVAEWVWFLRLFLPGKPHTIAARSLPGCGEKDLEGGGKEHTSSLSGC